MNTRVLRGTRWAALLFGGAALAAVLLWLLSHPTALASSHSAERSFSASWAAPGAELEVTVAVSGYGAFGRLEETLPEGFEYVSSEITGGIGWDVDYDSATRTVEVTFLGSLEAVVYTVRAPQTAGMYTFSGELTNQSKETEEVGGASVIRIGPPPTATPTATPTPVPTATSTPTPEPTATPTPIPTATSAPEPTAASAPEPTATSVTEPTSTPVPSSTVIATATATTPTTPGGEGGEPTGLIILIAALALLTAGGAVYVLWWRRRRRW